MRDKEKQAKEKLETLLHNWRTAGEEKRIVVDEEEILHVVAKWTGIPLKRMGQDETQRLLTVEAEMEKVVIGQREACFRAVQGVAPFARGFERPEAARSARFFCSARPAWAKRLLAKTLAEQMFGDAKSLIHLDMSEYMEKFNVSRLIGSPPGYVGYEEGGQLTEKVRRNPYSVVLFDEIEKAHPDVWNMLLQILEDGKLTDNIGHVVNFRNTIILMTSNVGSDTIKKQSTLGFSPITDESSYEKMRERILDEAKRTFRPEFLNRLDDVIVFRSFTKPDLIQILTLEVGQGDGASAAQKHQAGAGRQGEGLSGGERLRPAIRRASDAPRGGAFPGRSAGRGNPARQSAAGRTDPRHERQGKTGVQPEGGGRRRGGGLDLNLRSCIYGQASNSNHPAKRRG